MADDCGAPIPPIFDYDYAYVSKIYETIIDRSINFFKSKWSGKFIYTIYNTKYPDESQKDCQEKFWQLKDGAVHDYNMNITFRFNNLATNSKNLK